jgi:hypothetical protein
MAMAQYRKAMGDGEEALALKACSIYSSSTDIVLLITHGAHPHECFRSEAPRKGSVMDP